MDRLTQLRTHITKEKEGIEIGPKHCPVAPKRAGYQCLCLDILSEVQLIEAANADPGMRRDQIGDIEPVDLLGSAQDIASLVRNKFGARKFDYVVSSHNFEHLPDPIRFLAACRDVLKPGGYVTMAIPDLRCCFDFFLPASTVGDLLEAYFECRTRPSDKQIFFRNAMRAQWKSAQGIFDSFSLHAPLEQIHPVTGVLSTSFAFWKDRVQRQARDYLNAHCWTFTPASFQLICLDLQSLSLLPFVVESVSGPFGNEFHVHLRAEDPVVEGYERRRAALMREMVKESSARNGPDLAPLVAELMQEIDELREALAATRNSTSWKVTAPIRKLKSLMRRGR
jgi:predicted SAM-dependent methyltransferase